MAPNQVPTWNYVAVHATGPGRLLPPQELRAHIAAVSAQYEETLRPKRPWTLEKLEPARLDGLLRAIVGIEIRVDSLQGTWKLSQNKSAEDRAAVARALADLPPAKAPGATTIARLMRDDG